MRDNTGINPFRSDEVCAQEQVVQLRKKLAEKDKLIEKLKTGRKPFAFLRKTASKINSAIGKIPRFLVECSPLLPMLAAAMLTISAAEKNDVYKTPGYIVNISRTPSAPPMDKDPELISPQVNETTIRTIYTILYKDKYGWRVENIADDDRNWWSLNELLTARDEPVSYLPRRLKEKDKLFFNDCRHPPFVGQQLNVYYKLGKAFRGRSWNKPVVDTICRTGEWSRENERQFEDTPR